MSFSPLCLGGSRTGTRKGYPLYFINLGDTRTPAGAEQMESAEPVNQESGPLIIRPRSSRVCVLFQCEG